MLLLLTLLLAAGSVPAVAAPRPGNAEAGRSARADAPTAASNKDGFAARAVASPLGFTEAGGSAHAAAPRLGCAEAGCSARTVASPLGIAEADVTGLTVRTVVTAAGFGATTGSEPQLPVSMTIANHTGRDLRNVEARQAFDGELDGASIAGTPFVTLGGVEYDSRGLMWQGHLVRNQVANVTYALTAPAGSPAREALAQLRPGSRLDTTITSSSAECG